MTRRVLVRGGNAKALQGGATRGRLQGPAWDPWMLTLEGQRAAEPMAGNPGVTGADTPVQNDPTPTHNQSMSTDTKRRRRVTPVEPPPVPVVEDDCEQSPLEALETAGVSTSSAASREAKKEADLLFSTADFQRSDPLEPALATPFAAIVESVFSLEDPEGLWKELETALELRDALTPQVLMAAVNKAEMNALKAHKLYVVAKSDCERFEYECSPVLESMRDSANRELQDEKDKKLRSKAITEADIKGRASMLFPDEWKRVTERQSRAEGMLENLKQLAKLWEQRCYSLSTMLNAGKTR